MYNPGQNIVDRITKVSKKGFSVECFTADFSQFSSSTVGWPAGYLPLIPSILWIIMRFPNFLRS